MALPTTSNTTRPRAQGYNARLNELYLRLVHPPDAPLQINMEEPQAPQLNTNENPEDFSPSRGKIFSRSSFYGGEGLAFAHRPNNTELDRTRYWDSENMNIERERSSDIPSLKLSNLVSRSTTLTSTVAYTAQSEDTFYMTQGTNVRFTTDPLNAAPGWTTEDALLGHVGTISGLVVLNNEPYVTMFADGVHRRTGGVWTHWSDLGASQIWTAKERIFGARTQNLYEVRAGAGSVLLHALESNKRWKSVTSVGQAVLAAATDGNIYTFTFQTDEATFDLSLFSRTTLKGEQPILLTSFYEEIFLVTSSASGKIGRLYRCRLTENFTLERDLIKEWGEENSDSYNFSNINSITTDRDSVFLGVVEKLDTTDYRVDIWRYNLEENALSRYLTNRYSGIADRPTIVRVLKFNGKITYTAYSDGGLTSDVQGLWYQTNNYASESYLITPLADFFTAVDKIWVTIGVDAKSESSADTIEIYYTTNPEAILSSEHNDWTLVTTIAGVNLSEELRILNVRGRYLAMMVKFQTTDTTTTPELYSISTRAYMGESDWVINLPVAIGDVVRRPGRRRTRGKKLGRMLHERLIAMQAESVVAEVFNPPITLLGAIDGITEQSNVQYTKGFPVQIAYVTVRGKLLSDTSNLTGENILGVGIMGIELMGGVDS